MNYAPTSSPPPSLQPIMRDQRQIDTDHLNLLAVFHMVGAGLALLGILFLFGHYMLFNTIMSSAGAFPKGGSGPSPEAFFSAFRWFYLVFGVWLLLSLVLNLLGWSYLRARKNRTFCMVVAGFNCIHVPLGTVLGVFTLVVLSRRSVLELFHSETNGAV